MTAAEGLAGGEDLVLGPKDYGAESLFRPVNLLREARRQQGLADLPVPRVGVLDPDGDIVRYLASSGRGRRHPGWACYHTQMWVTDLEGVEVGVVGSAVGAPFAVLVAEQLAASGAELVISITSAGRVGSLDTLPCFLLITKALRDEGTSAHYLPPSRWSHLDDDLGAALSPARGDVEGSLRTGASWTTDAPYRETHTAITAARRAGAVCVEMEAAALYAYAAARHRRVVCLAHVTNTMGADGEDFEKGDDNGAPEALRLIRSVVAALEGESADAPMRTDARGRR